MSPSPLCDPLAWRAAGTWPCETFAGRLPLAGRLVPHGDGQAVLVLPGFMASDRSTIVLREVMRAHGYKPEGWRLGRNLGPSDVVIGGLVTALENLHRRDGRRVSIVGWSLGGLYARFLARARPALVRQVITLASPFRMEEGERGATEVVWEEVETLHGNDEITVPESLQPMLRVPATSIYTRTDGVVRWQLCIDDTGPRANPQAENIEVYTTHIGIGFNPSSLFAVLDRLAQPEDDWRPFVPPPALRLLYPPSPSRPAEAAA